MRFNFDPSVVGPWVAEKAGGEWTGGAAIGVEDENGLFVGVMYDGFTGSNIMVHSRCDKPTKVPSKFYWMIFDYPFNQLKVKRVSAIVNVNNQRAIKVNEHSGFQREHVLRDYFPDGDAILYVMYKDDCRFLRGRYALRRL